MRNTIRLSVLLSATALFASACTNMPADGQGGTYGSTYNNDYNTNTASASVPEAGPLTEAANTNYAPTYTASPVASAQTAAPVPVATVPQFPAQSYDNSYAAAPAQPAYTAPAAPAAGGYDSYAANTDTLANTSYDYSGAAGSSGDYNSYNTAAAAPAGNAGGNDYYSNTDAYASNTAAAPQTPNYATAGGAAIQVFASVSQAKAERIRQEIASQGLNAVVDEIGGLYKVRVPYSSESEARAGLMRVRQASGEAGAFVTRR